ncbi:membrane progestin receptor beta [Gadus macrocephalus]|uniref:membrane progestin receptor beta n=1 Tax=Gadus macrocephalus TaxID=80720 RepID=UPI0028CBBB8F|nr:membrane progestin receptor beta [Gadus macrocephalus]
MPRVSLSCPSLQPLKGLLITPAPGGLPSQPSTLRDADVPALFREPYILSGYRPVGLSWRCYVLSIFQMHNETLNVWSHLLAGVCVALRFGAFAVFRGGGVLGLRLQGPEGQGLSLDPASLPLVIYVLSSLTYLSCSTATHLLQSHSELAHYSLFFLDYVGVAVYQYGCALALFFYSSAADWRHSKIGEVFLPAAALLAWLTCASCCFAKLHYRRPYPLHRKLFQVVPTGLAYLLDISPVAHSLATNSWDSNSAFPLHSLQMLLFILAAFFFSCPVPERYAPGHFDNVGHGHQLFHLLLALCTLAQQEALFQDFLSRRPAMIRDFGEGSLLLACGSFPLLALCSGLIAFLMRRRARMRLWKEQR